ncbi:hypothetical protein Zmor_012960 [Zophobas morio]|uniref:Uncharacterized protein n=1 Tax=Zophobas morio TaxID=2755281 RepID=A0AA38MEW5_9CUCU|nr:hypothetical protein Zmor_012960 [Zophobas morio]
MKVVEGGRGGRIDGRRDEVNSSESGGFSRRFRPSYPEYIWCLFGIRITRRPWTYKDRNPSVNSFGPAAPGGRRTCFVQQETWKTDQLDLISSL